MVNVKRDARHPGKKERGECSTRPVCATLALDQPQPPPLPLQLELVLLPPPSALTVLVKPGATVKSKAKASARLARNTRVRTVIAFIVMSFLSKALGMMTCTRQRAVCMMASSLARATGA